MHYLHKLCIYYNPEHIPKHNISQNSVQNAINFSRLLGLIPGVASVLLLYCWQVLRSAT